MSDEGGGEGRERVSRRFHLVFGLIFLSSISLFVHVFVHVSVYPCFVCDLCLPSFLFISRSTYKPSCLSDLPSFPPCSLNPLCCAFTLLTRPYARLSRRYMFSEMVVDVGRRVRKDATRLVVVFFQRHRERDHDGYLKKKQIRTGGVESMYAQLWKKS